MGAFDTLDRTGIMVPCLAGLLYGTDRNRVEQGGTEWNKVEQTHILLI